MDQPGHGGSEDVAIRLEGVSKVFPGSTTPAVRELSLEMAKGTLTALVGPSGCGKTTTLKMINRLIEPTSGRILVDGRDARDRPVHELRRDIGYVIQQVGLFPHQTIATNIGTVPRLLGWDKRRVHERVAELVDGGRRRTGEDLGHALQADGDVFTAAVPATPPGGAGHLGCPG